MTRPILVNEVRTTSWKTRWVRAVLFAVVPMSMVVQATLAHASPVSQTFRNNATLTSFSGTFEAVWARQILVAGAVIELRDAASATLQQSTESSAVQLFVLCPGLTITYTCARISLTDIPELAPGAYSIYWHVVHTDGAVEQRSVRFKVDPSWVAPSPVQRSPTPTPTPSASTSATPRPTAKPTPSRSDAASPVPTPSLQTSPSASAASPVVTPTPAASSGADEPGSDEARSKVGTLLAVVGLIGIGILIWRLVRSAQGR